MTGRRSEFTPTIGSHLRSAGGRETRAQRAIVVQVNIGTGVVSIHDHGALDGAGGGEVPGGKRGVDGHVSVEVIVKGEIACRGGLDQQVFWGATGIESEWRAGADEVGDPSPIKIYGYGAGAVENEHQAVGSCEAIEIVDTRGESDGVGLSPRKLDSHRRPEPT